MTIIAVVFSMTCGVAAEEAKPAEGKHRAGHHGHDGHRIKLLKSMNLTEEQRKDLRKIFEARKAEIDALGKRKGNLEKIKTIVQKYDPQIKAIIGDANFQKLLAHRKAHMEKRKAHHHKRQHGEKPAAE